MSKKSKSKVIRKMAKRLGMKAYDWKLAKVKPRDVMGYLTPAGAEEFTTPPWWDANKGPFVKPRALSAAWLDELSDFDADVPAVAEAARKMLATLRRYHGTPEKEWRKAVAEAIKQAEDAGI